MAKTYLAARINFLSFNLAGHDAVTEGYRNEWDFEYAGGALTDFTIAFRIFKRRSIFCNDFSNRIILQGHSIGCDRILHYLLASGSRHDFILLSPCDSYQLQADWIKPETVEQQIDRLKKEISDEGKIDCFQLISTAFDVAIGYTPFISLVKPYLVLCLAMPFISFEWTNRVIFS